MALSQKIADLDLTVEEAFALLELAMTSPMKLDENSEAAMQKLAGYCRRIETEACRSQVRFSEAAG